MYEKAILELPALKICFADGGQAITCYASGYIQQAINLLRKLVTYMEVVGMMKRDFEKKHEEMVRKLAPECTVLLKKDGLFPLISAGKIAVYGNGVRKTIKGGTGSGDVNVRHFVNVEEGLQNAGFEITTGAWLDGYEAVWKKAQEDFFRDIRETAEKMGIFPMMYAMGKTMPEPEYELPLNGEGDTAVYILSRISGEGSDRNAGAGDIGMTETEIRDILALNQKYEKFMLVLNVGGLVDLTPVRDVKNILLLGQLGTPTGDVLADILLGKSYPSGKLTMTWAPLGEYPSTEGFGHPDDTYYREGIYVGYRYFDSAKKEVLYPFGYGLGYTDFEWELKEVSGNENEVTVTAHVKNSGESAGKEVLQLYYSAPCGKMDRPYQELAGFAKTKELLPGEACDVTISFRTKDMAAYDESEASYILEKGTYTLRLGNSSRSARVCAVLNISDTAVTRKLRNICAGDGEKWRADGMLVIEDTKCTSNDEYAEDIARIDISTSGLEAEEAVYSEEPSGFPENQACDWEDVKAGRKSIEEFIAGLSEEELAALCVGFYTENGGESVIGVASASVAGAAGETTDRLKEKYHMDHMVFADGPAGIRVSPVYKVVNGQIKSKSFPFGEELMGLLTPEELAVVQQGTVEEEEERSAPEQYQYCTAIPIGTDLAQSFNRELVKTCGDIVGREMEEYGIQLWLAPALNIQRSPLCGRNFEYYSEDPLVGGIIAAAMTEGVQRHKGCGTTIKHFACNNQETNRYTSNSVLTERALREIYLRGFEICIRNIQPHAVMTSYNLVNGEHACNSKDLLTHVLRDEWGYEGIVMTDWYVTVTVMKNPNSKYAEASAAGCVKAGNDLVMPGAGSDVEDILKALSDEKHPYHLTRGELEACADRIFRKIRELYQ